MNYQRRCIRLPLRALPHPAGATFLILTLAPTTLVCKQAIGIQWRAGQAHPVVRTSPCYLAEGEHPNQLTRAQDFLGLFPANCGVMPAKGK
ncbi:uncharacterized protein SCHCODRAFT_02198760 [Schizophyllum commune H4-8]|uniref:uncharacterized protein n=1 Tax=Schizophyllum commune (strain H4-8 / FGSC 9210) TaxID=578458 RepID=UPI0021610108|nr:uncharacterized protein SCHCODRAFT_02198760 [Schizophyllum commune H4-8]KAI5896776.1 hypothetical protein SCHCODRAFT_02198760 [Schizophyllum commune H4-8]